MSHVIWCYPKTSRPKGKCNVTMGCLFPAKAMPAFGHSKVYGTGGRVTPSDAGHSVSPPKKVQTSNKHQTLTNEHGAPPSVARWFSAGPLCQGSILEASAFGEPTIASKKLLLHTTRSRLTCKALSFCYIRCRWRMLSIQRVKKWVYIPLNCWDIKTYLKTTPMKPWTCYLQRKKHKTSYNKWWCLQTGMLWLCNWQIKGLVPNRIQVLHLHRGTWDITRWKPHHRRLRSIQVNFNW